MTLRTKATRLLVAALAGALAGALALAPAADGKPRHRAKKRAHAARHGRVVRNLPPALINAARPSFGAPAPIGPAPTGPAPSDPSSAPAPQPAPAPAISAVGVQVDETPDYVALLSRPSVPAGSVVIQLQNTGEDPHDLRVMREDGTGTPFDFPRVGPGTTVTRTLTLAPGSYRLFCTLSAPVSHDAAGMHATLTVLG